MVRAPRPSTYPAPANPGPGFCRPPAGGLVVAPNVLELTGDGGATDGVRCSDVLGAGVLGLVDMGLLPPYARDGGSSRCRACFEPARPGVGACGAWLWDQPIARPGLFTAAPNPGVRRHAKRVRCNALLGGAKATRPRSAIT